MWCCESRKNYLSENTEKILITDNYKIKKLDPINVKGKEKQN